MEIYLFGVIFLICGISTLMDGVNEDKETKSIRYKIAFVILLFAAIEIIGAVLKNMVLVFVPILLLFGGISFSVSVLWLTKKRRCDVPVEAICVGKEKYPNPWRINSPGPIFSYEYEGSIYQNEGDYSYKSLVFNRKYKVGGQYIIFIDKEDPNIFVLDRKINADIITFLIMGTLCFLAAIYLCIPGVPVPW